MPILPVAFFKCRCIGVDPSGSVSHRCRGVDSGGDGVARDMCGCNRLPRGAGGGASGVILFNFSSSRMGSQ